MGISRWATDANITLTLELVSRQGAGASTKSPEVAILRHRDEFGNLLDNYYWTGSGFTSTPTFHTMTPIDDTNLPGLYTYLFDQSVVGLSRTYIAYYKHDDEPPGFASDTLIVSNEIFVPKSLGSPLIIGTQTVIGLLEQIKDGGTGLFEPAEDSLHNLKFGFDRILGLLHENAYLDNQTYDVHGQLESARLRVFDDSSNVPTAPGGSETTGLTQEYLIEASYVGVGVLNSYRLTRVL